MPCMGLFLTLCSLLWFRSASLLQCDHNEFISLQKVKSRFFHPSEILWRRSWAVSMWSSARWTLPCHMRSLEPPHPCSSSCPLESTRWRTWRNTVQMHVISKWRPFTSFHQNAAVILKLRCHFGIFQMPFCYFQNDPVKISRYLQSRPIHSVYLLS